MTTHAPIDRGWAWLVMVAAYGCLFANGVAYSLGVYVAELIIEQNLDRPSVALFGSLQIALNYGSGPMSYVSELTSHRLVIFVASFVAASSTVASIYIKSMTVLYFTFGVIPGFCVGTLALQSCIIMNRYFKKRAGFANCFALAGCATATLVLPPLFRANIQKYGWRSSLFIVAGIFLQGCVFSMCMRPVKAATPQENSNIVSPSVIQRKSVYRKPSFYLFIASLVLWCFSWPVVFVFAPTLFYEHQMAGWQIDLLMSLLGASNMVVRLGSAFVFSITNWNMIIVHTVTILTLTASLVLFVVYPSMAFFTISTILFGLSYGCANCTQSLVSRHIGKIVDYNVVYSWSFAACILGSVFGPFLSGYIYNATHSHTVPFLCCAGISLLSAAAMVVVFFIDRKSYPNDTLSQHLEQSHEVEAFL